MKPLKLWLNISPFIPIIGVFLVLFQVTKYNNKNSEIRNYGIFNFNIFITSAILQAASYICLIILIILI